MLDNLRGMGVFASVVRHGSFSGAAKEFGITTSAISQQIRSLETDLGVSLLHRSTRKLSLTEAGESLFTHSVQMLKAAEMGRDSVINLKDEISGSLRIATTPELCKEHLLPALSSWLNENKNLQLNIISKENMDMIEDRVDLALTISDGKQGKSLAPIKQFFVASPRYIEQSGIPSHPKELSAHDIIHVSDKDTESVDFRQNNKKINVRLHSRLYSNNPEIALHMACTGKGILKTNALLAEELIREGKLVPILQDYQLPELYVTAFISSKEPVSAKVKKCLQVLESYFENESA